MKLSLCLSSYLRRSLGGYTVGTTMGFPVETVEDLPPQSVISRFYKLEPE
jgi:hypothetical protein